MNTRPDVTALLKARIKPGSVFFEVGANAGYLWLVAHDLGTNVHAFEPNPSTVPSSRRASQLDSHGVTLNPEAVSTESGAQRHALSLRARQHRSNSLDREPNTPVEVSTVTLNDRDLAGS